MENIRKIEGEDSSTWWSGYLRPSGWENDDTGCYATDENYLVDREQIRNSNLWETGESYWLASRRMRSAPDYCVFDVRRVTIDGNLDGSRLCDVTRSGTINAYSGEYGLRPCFLLKSDIRIIEGDGKSPNTAYIIE